MFVFRRHLLTFCFFSALFVAVASAGTPNINVKLVTPVGNMTLELYGNAKPITVKNFLLYLRDGFFQNTFAHRLPQGFVLQGGVLTVNQSGGLEYISTYAPITNEAGPFPLYSNVKGTIVMAKIGGNPNSATGSWFINLQNNNTGTAEAGNLDLQNGGFTVFGRVINTVDTPNSLTVLDRFAAFQNQQFINQAPVDGNDLIAYAGSDLLSDVPFKSITNGQLSTDNLIYTTWTVLSGPVPVITSPSSAYIGSGATFSYQITSSDSPTSYSVTGGTLPAGLLFNSSTGLISGTLTATAPASIDLTVNAINGDGTGSASLSLGINYPVIPDNLTVTGKVGQAFQYQISATNSPLGYGASGLPDGLSINSTTGLISGTPTKATDPITISISAGNEGGTYTSGLTITILPATPPNLLTAKKVTGSAGKVTLKGSADAGTMKVEVKAGKGAFKKTKGTPASWKFPVKGLKPGKYKFQIRATNTVGLSSTKTVVVLIKS